MSISRKIIGASLALALGLSLAAPALARDGEDEGRGASLNATVSAEIHAGDKGKSDGTSTQELKSRERESQDEDLNENESAEIEVDREHASTTAGDVRHSEDVQNFGQLRSFAAHVINEERHVNRVNLSSTTVRAHVDTPASLLGIIPATVGTQVDVAQDGSVNVTYPWYAFLFKKNTDAVKAQITTAVSQTLASSSLSAEEQQTLSAKLQATILQSIVSSLKSLFQ